MRGTAEGKARTVLCAEGPDALICLHSIFCGAVAWPKYSTCWRAAQVGRWELRMLGLGRRCRQPTPAAPPGTRRPVAYTPGAENGAHRGR